VGRWNYFCYLHKMSAPKIWKTWVCSIQYASDPYIFLFRQNVCDLCSFWPFLEHFIMWSPIIVLHLWEEKFILSITSVIRTETTPSLYVLKVYTPELLQLLLSPLLLYAKLQSSYGKQCISYCGMQHRLVYILHSPDECCKPKHAISENYLQ
jgi:hypothetical protein